MQKNDVSVEANLLAKKSKLRVKKRMTIKEEPSSSSDVKLDTLVKNMVRVMERMTLTDRVAPKNHNGVLRLGIQISEGSNPKLSKGSQETQQINNKLELLFRKIIRRKKIRQQMSLKRIISILLVKDKYIIIS